MGGNSRKSEATAGLASRCAGVALAATIGLSLGAAGPASAAKDADFGDAPDSHGAVPGNFPSSEKNDGPNFGDQSLKLGASADGERDSNQVNADPYDDGVEVEHVPCQQVVYRFEVNAAELAKRKRSGNGYLNLFVDWNLDGDWQDVDKRCGNTPADEVPEHRVQNEKVNLDDFGKDPVQTIKIKAKAGGTATQTESGELPFWIRGILSDERMPAPGDGSARRAGNLGEVEDYGPDMILPNGADGDFGDAPDGFDTQGTPLEPLCRRSIVPFRCLYPSFAGNGGPLHLEPFPVGLGDDVTVELDSNQTNIDEFDDGFALTSFGSCANAIFTFDTAVGSVRDPRYSPKEFALLRKVIRGIDRRDASIYLNAWVDFNNDGDWADHPLCTQADGSELGADEHVIQDKKLTGKELKALDKSIDSKGARSKKFDRKGPLGDIAPEGLGCARGMLTVDEKYADVAPAVMPSAHIRAPFVLGETEDECAPGGGTAVPPTGPPDPGGSTTKCNDGIDNDGDGLIDASDPGCQTGPFGAHDPADHNEGHLAGGLDCPSPSTGKSHTIKMFESGTLHRHIFRLGGVIVVDKGQGDSDFASGSTADPIQITCPNGTVADVTIAWTTSGTPEGGVTPIIEYQVFLTYVSGPGGGTFDGFSAAPNTR